MRIWLTVESRFRGALFMIRRRVSDLGRQLGFTEIA
jgi:hypothetical protein